MKTSRFKGKVAIITGASGTMQVKSFINHWTRRLKDHEKNEVK